MKLLLVIIGLTIGLNTFAQIPVKNGTIFYEQIDSLPGMVQSDIYKRSKLWIVQAFKDAKEVIQIDNKDEGEIVGKGSLDCTYTLLGTGIPCRVFFTIKLNSKDGKHRIQLYDFTGYRYTGNQPLNFDKVLSKPNASENKRIIAQIDGQITAMLLSLKSELIAKKDDF